jgi:hypothetical protein
MNADRKFRSRLGACLVVGGAVLMIGAAAMAAEPDSLDGKQYTVNASVQGNADPFIRARQETGPFTVPKGYRATNFQYHFADVQSGYQSDKLRAGNIRVLRGGLVGLNVGEADFSLGPGDYVFVVGGLPGAVGSLSFTLAKAEAVLDGSAPGERIIDAVTWSPEATTYKPKTQAVYHIREGKVIGEIHQTLEPPQYDNGVTCDPLPVNGKFEGSIAGNVITGKWQVKTSPHRMHFPGINGPPFDRTDSFTQSYESRLVLYSDGTLSETMKGEGTTEWEWGPTAPEGAPGESKHGSYHYEYTIPGEHLKQPMQGTWTQR